MNAAYLRSVPTPNKPTLHNDLLVWKATRECEATIMETLGRLGVAASAVRMDFKAPCHKAERNARVLNALEHREDTMSLLGCGSYAHTVVRFEFLSGDGHVQFKVDDSAYAGYSNVYQLSKNPCTVLFNHEVRRRSSLRPVPHYELHPQPRTLVQPLPRVRRTREMLW